MSKLSNTTEFIIGGTGTGKTYLAAKTLKESYDKKERVIYTNINLNNGFDDYIQEFDKEELYEFAQEELALYKHFQNLSKIYKDTLAFKEDELIFNDEDNLVNETIEDIPIVFDKDDVSPYHGNYDNYLKASGILDKFGGSMILWDECQEDLTKDGKEYFDLVWGRFFSYRRHFGIHLIMLTQDFDLIHRKYKKYGDKFYFAQNSSRRYFSKMLRYETYFKYQEFKKYHLKSLNILMNKEIQNFYDTGEKNLGKTVIGKFLFIPIIFIVVIYFIYGALFGEKNITENDNNSTIQTEELNQTKEVTNDEYNELDTDEFERADEDRLIFFNCNLKNCNIRDNSFTIPLVKMAKFAKAVNMEILYSSKINNYYSLIVVSVNESLYNELMKFSLSKKGDKHEKGEMDFSSPVNFNK